MSDPRNALDYPHLDGGLFVLWSGNEYNWPHARRTLAFIGTRRHNVNGFALFTTNAEEAATFPTKRAALAFLRAEEKGRPHAYAVKCTTVAQMRIAKGYDSAPVPVIFRAVKSGDHAGTVEAFFPTLPGTNDPHTCTVFAHVGQHCSASKDYYRDTRPATPEEAAPLQKELEGAPYRYALDVRKRWTPEFDHARRLELNRPFKKRA